MIRRISRKKLLALLVVFAALLAFVACAPGEKEPTNDSDTDPVQSLELPAWTPASDCASCHVKETESGTISAAGYAVHVPEGVECGTCHVDTDGKLAQAHKDYATDKLPSRLKTNKVNKETCLTAGCHVLDELKAATADLTLLEDSKGTVVNPHDPPDIQEHENGATCVSCHKMHVADELETTAPKTCLSCHHGNVYECGTCHE
jgi:hypothetical protein